MRTQSMAIMEDMSQLGTQAEGIGQVLDVIADIADQTNLLAQRCHRSRPWARPDVDLQLWPTK